MTHATLTLDTHFDVGPIDRRIFGGFLEHLGRAIYTGIYDPDSPLADERGFRKDVLAALRPLCIPVVRYPGGNYVSAADWRDGIGPPEQRPRRPDYAWRSIETNRFGTDELVDWCTTLGAEPFLAVNLGTLGAAEAAQLVEYCNLPGGTLWSDRRRTNGHPEPHAVKLWGLGNEMDGPWQAGHCPAHVYARRARQASALMKGIDRGIETIACGSSYRGIDSYLEWDREVLEIGWDGIDFISAHRYSGNRNGDTASYLAEGVELDRILADYRALIGYVRGRQRSDRRVYLAFDEWNVWYRTMGGADADGNWAVAPPLLEEAYSLEDAIVVAEYLLAFVRNADLVKIACLAQLVNVIAPVLTRPDGLLLQTIYHPFAMISAQARGRSLVPVVDGPRRATLVHGEVPTLDAAASFEPETGVVVAYLVNRDPEHDLLVEIRIDDRTIASASDAQVFGGGDAGDTNRWDAPARVTPRPADVTVRDGTARLTVPAPGLAVVRLATRER